VSEQRFQVCDVLPGDYRVVAISGYDPQVPHCWDCSRGFGSNQTGIVFGQYEGDPDRYELDPWCAEFRRQHSLHFVPERRHAEALAQLTAALDALTEVNVPGGEHEELIDELGQAHTTYVALLGDAAV
jgi:hypothetical protein